MPQDAIVKEHFQRMGQDGSYAAFYGEPGPATHDFYARRDRVQDFLESHIKAGQSVLDIGCGTGPMVEFCCSRGLHYFGLDVAPSMLESIAQQFKDTPYWSRIKVGIGSSENIPYPDSSFDVVIGMGLLEYFHDMQPTFEQIARVLKPGGLAVLSIPNTVSVNRFIIRHSEFLTSLYRFGRRLAGAKLEARRDLIHKELTPRALDSSMTSHGFEAVGRAFYDHKLICFPVTRIFPNLAYHVNRRMENRAPYYLANGYIGFYRKQGTPVSAVVGAYAGSSRG